MLRRQMMINHQIWLPCLHANILEDSNPEEIHLRVHLRVPLESPWKILEESLKTKKTGTKSFAKEIWLTRALRPLGNRSKKPYHVRRRPRCSGIQRQNIGIFYQQKAGFDQHRNGIEQAHIGISSEEYWDFIAKVLDFAEIEILFEEIEISSAIMVTPQGWGFGPSVLKIVLANT